MGVYLNSKTVYNAYRRKIHLYHKTEEIWKIGHGQYADEGGGRWIGL